MKLKQGTRQKYVKIDRSFKILFTLSREYYVLD